MGTGVFHLGTVRLLDGSTIVFMDALTSRSDQKELNRLNHEYPGWRVWRSRHNSAPAKWVASNLDPQSPHDPTLHGDSAEELENRLEDPPLRIGRPLLDKEVAR